MSNKSAVVIEKLHKKYTLGVISVDTLASDLSKIWKFFNSKLFFKLNSNKNSLEKKQVWALKNINLKIETGDIVGLIGSNGAGKSTLLKILSRITTPSIGTVKIKGRIASLLEVGTGFHPELTGKENIFLNGAILGMSKNEINQKLDKIIDFSGVSEFINTPVKRYSSGMRVRLAFSVAAYLEPEILLIDEVLAVGDADFQKKCLGKMKNISESGRTILFVSHNMTAIKSICNRAIVLDKGRVKYDSDAIDAVDFYLKGSKNHIKNEYFFNSKSNDHDEKLKIVAVKIKPKIGNSINVSSGIIFTFDCYTSLKKLPIYFGFEIFTEDGVVLANNYLPLDDAKNIKSGYYSTKVEFPGDTLNVGVYNLVLWYGLSNSENLGYTRDKISFEVFPAQNNRQLNKVKGLLNLVIPYNTSHYLKDKKEL